MTTDLQKQLDYLTGQIKLYKEIDIMDGEGLVNVLQQITTTLFFLENERSIYHARFQSTINELVLGGSSVSRAENMANVQIPEMYMMRRIMDSAYRCVDALRSQISWAKTERNSI
jgi:hypothetical protein